jgi:uncharacterized damage-inducible protein DinB
MDLSPFEYAHDSQSSSAVITMVSMSAVPAWFDRTFEFGFPVEQYPTICIRLLGTPARLEELLKGVEPEVSTGKPDGKWSIQEHAGHLADMEPLWLWRVEDFVSGRETLTIADLTNARTHEANHNSHELRKVLNDFRSARFDLLERLNKLDPGQFARTLVHPRLQQPMRLVDHLYFVAEHDDHHLATIRHLIGI